MTRAQKSSKGYFGPKFVVFQGKLREPTGLYLYAVTWGPPPVFGTSREPQKHQGSIQDNTTDHSISDNA